MVSVCKQCRGSLEAAMQVWCGIDLGEANTLAVVNRKGELLTSCDFTATLDGLRRVQATIARHGKPHHAVQILLESPNGLVADWLLTHNYDVRHVHPVASAAYRRAHSRSRAKSDAGDAQLLANLVRTNFG